MNWLRTHTILVSVFIAIAGTITLSTTMSFEEYPVAYSNSTLSAIFFIFSAVLLYRIYKKLDFKDKRGVPLAFIFSFFLSLALIVGKQLQTNGSCEFSNPMLGVKLFFLTLYFIGFILYILQTSRPLIFIVENKNLKQGWKSFLETWVLIFLCWIPVFLAFYPGAFVYDARDEYVQVATREFTTHHPLLHVLLLGGTVQFGYKYLGSYNTGIALYTIFQMVICSGTLAYFIQFILHRFLKNSANKQKIKLLLILLYGFFPIFPMYAVCSSKDTLFYAALLLCIIQMFEILYFQRDIDAENSELKKRNIKGNIGFIVTSMLMLLLRNNAVHAYVVILIIVLLGWGWAALKKRFSFCIQGKRLMICMLLSLLLYKTADICMITIFDASASGKQEVLTVPIQQLARVHKYSKEVFNKEEKEKLYSYIPEEVLEKYYAKRSDDVKYYFNNEKFNEDPSGFFKLWLKIGLKKPAMYINAWLMTSYGFWYPDTVINVCEGVRVFTFEYKDSSYFGFETEPPGERDSKFLWLQEQYRKISLDIFQQKVPAVSMLFSPGFLFWIFSICGLILIYQRDYFKLIPWGFIFLFWLTFLLGPTFVVRYVLFLWLVFPLEILILKRGK